MKRFIILLLGLILIGGLCSADRSDSKEGVLVKKTFIQAHHTENCSGHEFMIGRIDFKQEGHDMWLFIKEGNDGKSYSSSDIINIQHSPECEKCNPKEKSIFDEPITETSTSSDWGW